MSSKTITVGVPIEYRCTKCRKITNHIIVAIENEKAAKAKCNTWEGEHKYRLPTINKTAKANKDSSTKLTTKKDWPDI